MPRKEYYTFLKKFLRTYLRMIYLRLLVFYPKR